MNRGKPAATLALASTPSPNLSNCPGLHLSLYLCLCSTPPDHICLSFYLVLCSLTHNTNIRCFSICHQFFCRALFFISPQPEMDLVFVKPPTFATKHRSIFASFPHREESLCPGQMFLVNFPNMGFASICVAWRGGGDCWLQENEELFRDKAWFAQWYTSPATWLLNYNDLSIYRSVFLWIRGKIFCNTRANKL